MMDDTERALLRMARGLAGYWAVVKGSPEAGTLVRHFPSLAAMLAECEALSRRQDDERVTDTLNPTDDCVHGGGTAPCEH